MVTPNAQWDFSADVVVVGFGAAGAATAITAHDQGAKVLVLEKAPEQFKGGNSRVSGQIVFWPNDIEKAIEYFKGLAGPYTDYLSEEIVHAWASEMHGNRGWLESLGMEVMNFDAVEYPDLPGSSCVEVILHKKGGRAGKVAGEKVTLKSRSDFGHARLWDEVIDPAFSSRRIPVLFDYPAAQLIRGKSDILGLIATHKGKEIRVRALRAVVLTCGGFQNNQAMIRTYLTDLPYCCPLGTPYNTGDGIRMAIDAGADLWHMNNLAGPYLAFKAPQHEFGSRLGAAKANSYIYVGRDGTRFVAETANLSSGASTKVSQRTKHGKVFRSGRYTQYPCPAPMHIIFDEAMRKAGGLCGKVAGNTFGWDVLYGDIYRWSNDNSKEIGQGWIKQGANASELAKKIGLCPRVLEATVQRYNLFCKNGADTDWNRDTTTLTPIAPGPIYAMEIVPASLNTQGGPVRNHAAQVMDVRGDPIPRLYSAGELGSIYAYKYQAGGNLGECFAFGRIAGRNAAALAPWTGPQDG